MLEIDSSDRRMTFTVTWPKVLAVVGAIIVMIGGATAYLGEQLVDGIRASVADLRTDTNQRFEGREEEDRDIRRHIEASNEKLRQEVASTGDRIVASSVAIGNKIDNLRDGLIDAIQRGDDRLELRFDRLEERLEEMRKQIIFQPGWTPPEDKGLQNPLNASE